jgi:O-antigen/teichoic acid export membrane protein
MFNVETDVAKAEAGPTVAVFMATFLVGLPFCVVQRVQVGYQEGAASNLWQSGGNALALVLVLVAIYFEAGLPLLVAAMAGSPLLVLLVNFTVYFSHSRPWLAPNWRGFSFEHASRLIRTGLLFFVLQTLTLVGASTDNLVITHALGPASVATYAVCMRLATVLSFTQFFITPLWPAFGEAMTRGNFAWAERAMWRTMRFTLMIAVPVAVLMSVFGKWIISKWVGPAVIPSTTLLLGFSAWTLLVGYGGILSVFLNSGNWLSRQVKLYTLATVVSFALKLLLVRVWGEGGVVWATVIAYGVLFTLPATWLVKTIFRECNAKSPVLA